MRVAAAQELIQMGLVGEALEGASVAVFVFDDDLRYVAANTYACELLGYTRDELLGLRLDALASADAIEDYAQVVSGARTEGVREVARKDGTRLKLRYRACETRVAGMKYYVGIAWPA